jgi:hypothetical protein
VKPVVTILTYGAHPALAYGTLLIFKTLRTGFPTADIEVFDNGSHSGVRDQIMAECQRVGASFSGISPQSWVDHYRWLLLERRDDGRPLVILDPDVVLWESVEDWSFAGSLVAGRLMRRIQARPIVQHARIHPSFLWVENLSQLRSAMGNRAEELIRPALGAFEGEVHFWDTFSRLYEEMVHWCYSFGPEKLDAFDHLFFGSHLPVIASHTSQDLGVIGRAHVYAASGNLEPLRGIWREQDYYFDSAESGQVSDELAKKLVKTRGQLPARRMDAARALLAAQCIEVDDDELGAAMEVLARRVQGKQEVGQ